MMKKSVIYFFLCILMMLSGQVWAQESEEKDPFSEDDIFSEQESVVAIEETIDETLTEAVEAESVSFSGEISANFDYALTRDYLDGDGDFEDNPYSTSIDGDFLLDVRLREGIKAFADLWATYTPQDSGNEDEEEEEEHFDTTLKEFFVDVNAHRKVYLRIGKQNLKWGRGYFWNPTDLISEDLKDFNDLDARLEGVYGVKMHIPFGTKYNIYSFLNASGANKTNEFSFAGKFEVLLPQDIEMAFSAWAKEGYEPVFGLDFATHKFNIDWRGELSLSYGDNRHRLKVKNDVSSNTSAKEFLDEKVEDEWTPRICLGFTKYFDYRDVNDRISLTGEFYYNHGGYDDNMLEDADTRAEFLQGDYFESGNYGKYYAAIFTSVSKFLVSDMSLNVNAIGNLSDSSFILSSGIDYELTYNASLSCNLKSYFGEKYHEYTLDGNAIGADISVNITF